MEVPLFIPVGVDPVPTMGRGVALLKVVQDLLVSYGDRKSPCSRSTGFRY